MGTQKEPPPPPSASDQIVARGREERVAMRGQGLKPGFEGEAHLDLANPIQRESISAYSQRVQRDKIRSNLIDSSGVGE